jgi:hypothetical protein
MLGKSAIVSSSSEVRQHIDSGTEARPGNAHISNFLREQSSPSDLSNEQLAKCLAASYFELLEGDEAPQ